MSVITARCKVWINQKLRLNMVMTKLKCGVAALLSRLQHWTKVMSATGHDPRYAKLTDAELPTTESLALTIDRVIPYWEEVIKPRIASGERVIIAAHGNSLRALVKYLDDLNEEEILELNIPTGVPLVYEFDENFKPIKHYYLGNAEEIAAKAAAVANQGKAK